MNNSKGKSLVELLLVIVIAAIIVLIAVPAYARYSLDAKFQEAFTTLTVLHTKEDLYWTDAHNYGSSDCAVGAPPGNTKYFSYICNINNSQQGYLITAKGQGDLLNYNFTIDQAGQKVTIDFPGVSGLPVPCWMHASGSCT